MSDDGDGGSPWTRPSVFLSIALLVFAVVAGSIVLVKSHHGSGPTAATPTVSTSSLATSAVTPSETPSAAPSTTTPSAAPVTPTSSPDQTIPVTGPPATWITIATLALPTSPLYGPKVNDGTVMAGYEHSPTGALFADADNRGRFGLVTDWQAATLSAVAKTPGRAAFLLLRKPYGVITPSPGDYTQLAGFNYLSYTPARAVIQILSTASDGSLLVTADTVVWQDNDWKVLLPTSGRIPAGTIAQSAAGFIPWQDNR